MTEFQTVIVTILGAIGGFFVALATARKMSAESYAISAQSFRELADKVQKLTEDNAELHRQIQELRTELTTKTVRIGELEREIDQLRAVTSGG